MQDAHCYFGSFGRQTFPVLIIHFQFYIGLLVFIRNNSISVVPMEHKISLILLIINGKKRMYAGGLLGKRRNLLHETRTSWGKLIISFTECQHI